MELNQEYWLRVMANPDKEVVIPRKVLWSIWNVLSATDFDNREEHWEHAATEVKRLLNETYQK